MEMSIAEMADKYTILSIKVEQGLKIEETLNDYLGELDGVSWQDLYNINLTIWRIEEEITREDDLREVGKLCMILRVLNLERVTEKNKIAENHGGPKELKRY